MVKGTQGVTALMYLTHLIVGHACKQELQKFATGKHHERPILNAGRGNNQGICSPQGHHPSEMVAEG